MHELYVSIKVTIGKIISVIDYKFLTTELIKVVLTALIGFFTFKIYQGYKNKKENNLLLVLLVKLRRELEENKNILNEVVSNSKRLNELEKKFLLNENSELYEIYKTVYSFNNYYYENIIYDFGEPVDIEYFYCDSPAYEINLIEQNIAHIRNEGDYEDQVEALEKEVKMLKSKSLIRELENLEEKLNSYVKPQSHKKSLEFLQEKLNTFNNQSLDVRKKSLNEFCKGLLDTENVLTVQIGELRELRKLDLLLKKPNRITNKTKWLDINFVIWKDSDAKELLIQYDVNAYMKLDELYIEALETKIRPWEVEVCNEANKGMIKEIEAELDKINKKLLKVIKRTEVVFKDI